MKHKGHGDRPYIQNAKPHCLEHSGRPCASKPSWECGNGTSIPLLYRFVVVVVVLSKFYVFPSHNHELTCEGLLSISQ